jgi:hypothetical protein
MLSELESKEKRDGEMGCGESRSEMGRRRRRHVYGDARRASDDDGMVHSFLLLVFVFLGAQPNTDVGCRARDVRHELLRLSLLLRWRPRRCGADARQHRVAVRLLLCVDQPLLRRCAFERW